MITKACDHCSERLTLLWVDFHQWRARAVNNTDAYALGQGVFVWAGNEADALAATRTGGTPQHPVSIVPGHELAQLVRDTDMETAV